MLLHLVCVVGEAEVGGELGDERAARGVRLGAEGGEELGPGHGRVARRERCPGGDDVLCHVRLGVGGEVGGDHRAEHLALSLGGGVDRLRGVGALAAAVRVHERIEALIDGVTQVSATPRSVFVARKNITSTLPGVVPRRSAISALVRPSARRSHATSRCFSESGARSSSHVASVTSS